ncbi:hypothetical protein HDU96_001987 [Phlyctochytrium bullatum]|nr:hypothetical protein HDU96_001987 [Phlyctochytrium bullatum]
MPLETLPVDVLLKIIRHLHPSSLHLLAATCRRFRHTLHASVLTYSFAKSHLELIAHGSPTAKGQKYPDTACLKGSRFDLPFLENHALAAGAVFGFSKELLEMMWGSRWADYDVPSWRREMVISAFRKGIWQMHFPTSSRRYKGDRPALEHAFNLAVHLRSFELVDILQKTYLTNTPADLHDIVMRLFWMRCIEKGFLEPIDLIPNHHCALSAARDSNSNIFFPLLVMAVKSLNPAAVSLLLAKGARPTPLALCRATRSCNHPPGSPARSCNPHASEIVRLLLDAGVDPAAPENPGGGGLTARRRVEAATILLAHGADIYITCGRKDFNVLHAVADSDKSAPQLLLRRLVTLLVDHGAELEESSMDRLTFTPLALACKREWVKLAVEMLRAGADPAALSWFEDDTCGEKPDKKMLKAVAALVQVGDSVAGEGEVRTVGDPLMEQARQALEQGDG